MPPPPSVYALGSEKTLEHLQRWYEEACKNSTCQRFVVIGNKVDTVSTPDTQAAEQFAKAIVGLLLASASFIAAPSVLRTAIRKANPGLYITSALGITFPFNMIVLLPVMFILSTILHTMGTPDFGYLVEGLK